MMRGRWEEGVFVRKVPRGHEEEDRGSLALTVASVAELLGSGVAMNKLQLGGPLGVASCFYKLSPTPAQCKFTSVLCEPLVKGFMPSGKVFLSLPAHFVPRCVSSGWH